MRKLMSVVPLAAAAIGAAVFFYTRADGREAAAVPAPGEAKSRPATIVQLSPAREMTFNESVASEGSVKARNYALVSSRIGGIIDDVFVREGMAVEGGKTKLFQIDNEKLEKAVEMAKQSLVIAKSTLEERRANLDKAHADLAQAEKDLARAESLYAQRVMALSEYEVADTKVAQLRAAQRVQETLLTLAEQNVTMAEISLDIAQKDRRDSLMLAPIDGVVTSRLKEPGEMAGADKVIIRIDDTRNLKAVAYLPGQYYPRIAPGTSVMHVTVLDKEIGEFPVTYKAPAIDSALRTFEIWADIPGDGAYVVPGAQCGIRVILKETKGVGVPRDAIQNRDGKQWIFVPDGDKAKMVEVKPGMETDGWTQLLDSPLKPGDKVITQGQFLLENGYPIRERGM